MVGSVRKKAASGRRRPSFSSTATRVWAAINEFPPRSKKLCPRPRSERRRAFAQIAANARSVSVAGGSKASAGSSRSRRRSASAARSTFPLGVSGSGVDRNDHRRDHVAGQAVAQARSEARGIERSGARLHDDGREEPALRPGVVDAVTAAALTPAHVASVASISLSSTR